MVIWRIYCFTHIIDDSTFLNPCLYHVARAVISFSRPSMDKKRFLVNLWTRYPNSDSASFRTWWSKYGSSSKLSFLRNGLHIWSNHIWFQNWAPFWGSFVTQYLTSHLSMIFCQRQVMARGTGWDPAAIRDHPQRQVRERPLECRSRALVERTERTERTLTPQGSCRRCRELMMMLLVDY